MTTTMPTPAMDAAETVDAMADAFHPSAVTGKPFHGNATLDAIEAALLWASKRISREEFLATIEDLGL